MTIDWENPFKPEDFDFQSDWEPTEEGKRRVAAMQANARFREILKECPVVYTDGLPSIDKALYYLQAGDDTHTARLIDIREIK